ncbi:MAG: hypothetical protein JNK05_01240 [Myxococcales bacterium]|nr:hypothetical protein [Myxococcales bacterium]
MNEHDEHPSLPPWDGSILAAEREREGPSPAQTDALFARLDQSIGAIGTPASPEADAAIQSGTSASTVPLTAAMALRKKLLGTALTYLVGVASGALAHDRLTRRAPDEPRPSAQSTLSTDARDTIERADAGASTVISQRIADAAPSVALQGLVVDAGRAMASVADAGNQRTTQARPVVRDSNDLIAETNVIEMARSALARGRASAALDAIEQHRRQFAAGQLAEDRESLAVEALVTLGRNDEAQRRAEAFRRRWPDGVYRARVDAALALIR